jgi:hypothetical protein
MMGYNSEASNQGVPMGGSFALNGGSIVFCCSAGAYVPVEQAVNDPLRSRRANDYSGEGQAIGYMSLISESDGPPFPEPERRRHFAKPEDEQAFLATQQQHDMKTCSCCPPKKISRT